MVRVAWASAALACAAPARADDLDLRPRWRPEWARFDLPNLILTGGASVTALTLNLAFVPRDGWKQDLLFDAAFRDALQADDVATRDALSDASDVLQVGIALYPLLVDAGLVAALVHDDPQLGIELALIGVETLAVSAVPIAATKSFVGRVRPEGQPCGASVDDFACRSRATRQSFISGHTAVAFTTAGMVCANHVHLDLYGGGVGDLLACGGAIGVATTTGLLRVASGRHYATDVVAGALVGFAIGYFVPTLLHYSSWGPMSLGVAPLPDGRGLAVTGGF